MIQTEEGVIVVFKQIQKITFRKELAYIFKICKLVAHKIVHFP